MKTCTQCKIQFEVTDSDRQFYAKMDVSEPMICPDCRNQRRMSWRNEKTLYKRKCDLCFKNIISIYSPDKTFPVYCQECFWSDKWNALDHCQDYDSDRPFFDQFEELMLKVPRLGIINKQSQNSDYCNYSFANKNCYLTFGNHYEEDCMYGRYSTKNKNCMDYLFTYNSQFCYEISFTKNSYESFYLENCDNCQSCYFSSDLISCKNCLFCSGLNHKEYYILNEPYSKEEYFSKLKEYDLHSYSGLQKAQKFFETEFPRKFPRRAIYQVNCEDCVGDNLNNCKNAYQCFDCTNCQDIAYAVQIDEAYDSMDMTCMGYDRSEVCYETIGCSGIFNCLSCDSCWHNHDLFYCNTCFSTKSCFGCVSLQHKNYCILNKQYSKEEYKEVMKGIIEDMKKTHSTSSGSCDWGGFFPTDISPYAYNETIANEYYPLSKEEISLKGWNWKKEEDKLLDVTKTIPAGRLPDTIADIPDDVLNWAIKCEQTDRLFKIQKQELEFYRKFNLPLPHYHPDVRFQMRMVRRQPRKLFERKCTKCGIDIKTTYAPNRPETVYCENCYLKNVY